MSPLIAVSVTFCTALVIVGLTTSALESWADARRDARQAYVTAEQQRMPAHAMASADITSVKFSR